MSSQVIEISKCRSEDDNDRRVHSAALKLDGLKKQVLSDYQLSSAKLVSKPKGLLHLVRVYEKDGEHFYLESKASFKFDPSFFGLNRWSKEFSASVKLFRGLTQGNFCPDSNFCEGRLKKGEQFEQLAFRKFSQTVCP